MARNKKIEREKGRLFLQNSKNNKNYVKKIKKVFIKLL